MEATRRLCSGVQTRDFWARTPRYTPNRDVTMDDGTVAKAGVEIKIGNTGLTNRTRDFREANGLISWIPRAGSEKLREAVWTRLSPQDRANNSTEHFEGLTPKELKEAKRGNKDLPAAKTRSDTHKKRQEAAAAAEKEQKDAARKAQRGRTREESEEEEENIERDSSESGDEDAEGDHDYDA